MSSEEADLAAQSRAAWRKNAAWWDDHIGAEGNAFHRELVAPAQLRLLGLRRGERVLDIACGNGQFARAMAGEGAEVVAFDFSETFIERARQHTERAGIAGIDYRVVDATDERELRSLGDGRFDAAVCTMALMDISDIEPLLAVLPELLTPGGRFVFSVPHPCFNSTGTRMLVEQEERDAELVITHAVKVVSYLDVPAQRSVGIAGQPEPHFDFHRPISELLNACFSHGFVLDAIEEPAHKPDRDSDGRMSWRSFTQIPPVLVARLRTEG